MRERETDRERERQTERERERERERQSSLGNSHFTEGNPGCNIRVLVYAYNLKANYATML